MANMFRWLWFGVGVVCTVVGMVYHGIRVVYGKGAGWYGYMQIGGDQ